MELYEAMYLEKGATVGDYIIEDLICCRNFSFYYSAKNVVTGKVVALCEIYPQVESIGVKLHRHHDGISIVVPKNYDKPISEVAKKYDDYFDEELTFITEKICNKNEEDYSEKIANKLKWYEVILLKAELEAENLPLNRYIAIEQCEENGKLPITFNKSDRHEEILNCVYYNACSSNTDKEENGKSADDTKAKENETKVDSTEKDIVNSKFQEILYSYQFISLIYCCFFNYNAMLKHMFIGEAKFNALMREEKVSFDNISEEIAKIYGCLNMHTKAIQQKIKAYEYNEENENSIYCYEAYKDKKSFFKSGEFTKVKKAIKVINVILLICCLPILIYSYTQYGNTGVHEELSYNIIIDYVVILSLAPLSLLWYIICFIGYGGSIQFMCWGRLLLPASSNMYSIKSWTDRFQVRLASLMPAIYISAGIMLIDMQNGAWSSNMEILRTCALLMAIFIVLFYFADLLSDIIGVFDFGKNSKIVTKYFWKLKNKKEFIKTLGINDKLLLILYNVYYILMLIVVTVVCVFVLFDFVSEVSWLW